ncbi:hypothetical protein FVE85_7577 [Porphyridium purpureum]|uniref:Ketopantoate reductase N-terminal domain-containing protein n=1 Tax=Porphyridium purpureum TaxID=35688 RepID=A0A5J4ZAD1_PORPP|nr:hypothetical protein FVE85_7577 [Porphyridium purpureum]|eukprot:POR0255..scf295_1
MEHNLTSGQVRQPQGAISKWSMDRTALCGFVCVPHLARSQGTRLCSTRHMCARGAAVRSTLRMEAQDVAAVIVGKGRIGSLLEQCGSQGDVVLGRGEQVPPEHTGPVYICTRNDDLQAIIEACPENKRPDLVFLQNGMLQPLLAKYGLAQTATLANVYFAVAKKGEPPIDGKTDTDSDGLTAASGKWAPAFAARVAKAGMSCKVLDRDAFEKSSFEKLIWICAWMLVGATHGGITVGQVEKEHREQVCELIEQLGRAVKVGAGVVLADGLAERSCAYSRTVAHFPTALKEFPWRNNFFYQISKSATEDPCPLHTELLESGKANGILSWEAPQ